MASNRDRLLRRWRSPLLFGLTVTLLAVAAAFAAARWNGAAAHDLIRIDYETYVAYARRFLETGSQYLPSQVVGPYLNQPLVAPELIPSSYPPTAIALFLPFVWLPALLWWAVPLGILAWAVASWRPGLAAWPFITACLIWPETSTVVIVGNSTMWVVAMTAAGLRWGWPAAFVILKPSLAFIAILGVRRPSFWLLVGAMLVSSLVLLPEWVRWFIALRNGSVPITYSLGSIPLVLIPILAWLGRRRRSDVAAVARPVNATSRRPIPIELEIG